jgi:hypothetical protein
VAGLGVVSVWMNMGNLSVAPEAPESLGQD